MVITGVPGNLQYYLLQQPGPPNVRPVRVASLEDRNGKNCGIIQACQLAAVQQQRQRWNREVARALKTKNAARTLAKKSMMPDDEIKRARRQRNAATKQNRDRTRTQVASLSMKYRAAKNAMLTGAMNKAAFEKVFKLTARQIAQFRAQFAARQRDIEASWNLVVERQTNAEKFLQQDLQKIDEVYEQTIASLADRYGKRIAYFQSLPVVRNVARYGINRIYAQNPLPTAQPQNNSQVCPIFEDGITP